MRGNGTFIQCLLAAVGGNNDLVIDQSQPNYTTIVDSYRYNLDYQTVPAAIAYPETVAQVAAAVKCAADWKTKVQARTGGHSYGNYALEDEGLTISTENLNAFSYDTSTGLATVGAGMLLGDLNQALWDSNHSCIPHGVSFSVGLGGHATVGGFGQLSRSAGLLADHVYEVQIVLANATVVRASATQNQDLFFALRGAGASFGVATEFILVTEPAPASVVSYTYSWAASDAEDKAALVKAWQAWIYGSELPWTLSATLSMSSAGTVLYGTYEGSQDEFDAIGIIGNFTAPDAASTQVYTDYRLLSEDWNDLLLQSVAASRGYFYAKSLLWADESHIADDVVDQLIEDLVSNDSDTQALSINFELLGGYTGTVPVTATAYPHRDAKFAMLLYARTNSTVSATTVGILTELNDMVKDSSASTFHGQYAGFVDPEEDADEARQAYWGANLDRLSLIKATVDPDDVFHNLQSVPVGK